jgi:hypothetical protein
LEIDTKKRILLRREIENYLFDPEILKLYRRDVDITSIFEEGFDYKKEYLKPKYQDIKHAIGFKGEIKDMMILLAEYITPETETYKELDGVIFS